MLPDLDLDAFWFVVLDHASAHTTAVVQAFAQRHQHRLELVYDLLGQENQRVSTVG